MAKRLQRRSDDSPGDSIRPAEQLLIDTLKGESAERVLCTSLGRGQFAKSYAERSEGSQVTCLFLDVYHWNRARSSAEPSLENLNLICQSDPPEEDFNLVAMPLTQGREAELTRDLMQSSYQRLELGGKMVAAVDNPKDSWLHEEMQRLFGKVRKDGGRDGVVYSAIKNGPLKKEKDFRSEFKFRDEGRLISIVTRPGVFSHRRLDTGARALLEVMQIQEGQRVLDIGCGAGVLGIAAGLRAEGVSVTAMDSHVRAVECTKANADLNGLDIDVVLDAFGRIEEAGTFDVALANPPYYSGYRISEIFLKAARRALKPGGQAYFVTKNPAWYQENMPKPFRDIEVIPSRGYSVIRGIRR